MYREDIRLQDGNVDRKLGRLILVARVMFRTAGAVEVLALVNAVFVADRLALRLAASGWQTAVAV